MELPEMANAARVRAPGPGGTFSLPIEGMTCASCVGRVERVLSALPSVSAANVNLATERAEVTFRGDPDPVAIVRAIEDAGYAVAEDSVEFQVDGMTCASCVGRVERALGATPGVVSASVNLATEKASVRYLAGIARAFRRGNVTERALCGAIGMAIARGVDVAIVTDILGRQELQWDATAGRILRNEPAAATK